MAVKKELFLHIFTLKSTKISVMQPDNYTGIESVVGIKKALDSDVADDFNTVSNLLRAGKVVHLNAITKDGKTHKILCAVATAISSLRGKSIAGSVVSSVGIPRRRRRG
jgi:hypothetical protein